MFLTVLEVGKSVGSFSVWRESTLSSPGVLTTSERAMSYPGVSLIRAHIKIIKLWEDGGVNEPSCGNHFDK